MITQEFLNERKSKLSEQLQNAINIVHQVTGAINLLQSMLDIFGKGVSENGEVNNSEQK